MVILAVAQIFMIYSRITSPSFYNQKLIRWTLAFDAYLLVWGISGNIHSFLEFSTPTDNTGLYLTLITAPVASYMIVVIYNLKMRVTLGKEVKYFKKGEEWVDYFLTVIPWIS
jgi:hypothetical protein